MGSYLHNIDLECPPYLLLGCSEATIVPVLESNDPEKVEDLVFHVLATNQDEILMRIMLDRRSIILIDQLAFEMVLMYIGCEINHNAHDEDYQECPIYTDGPALEDLDISKSNQNTTREQRRVQHQRKEELFDLLLEEYEERFCPKGFITCIDTENCEIFLIPKRVAERSN